MNRNSITNRAGILQRMQWLFAMLAVVTALWSVTEFHAHDDGFHASENSCYSCSLEDATSHGTLVSAVLKQVPDFASIEQRAFHALQSVAVIGATTPIRAPPYHS